MSTGVKILLTIVAFLICGAIVGAMMDAHIFGKFIFVLILMFVLKVIWSRPKETTSTLTTNLPPQKQTSNSTSQEQILKNNTANQQNGSVSYNGGHNAEEHGNSSRNISSERITPPTETKNVTSENNKTKEFDPSKLYGKN